MTKVISILGIEKADFAYYLSLLLKQTDKAVLIIDNSLMGELFRIVSLNDTEAKETNILEQKNIVYIRGLQYNQEVLEKFDYVVSYNGQASCDSIVRESSHLYFMPDYHLSSMDAVKRQIVSLPYNKEETQNVTVIMRDLVSEKITDKAVANYLEVAEECIAGHITDDITDHAKHIALQYNGKDAIKGLSEDYIDALKYVFIQITGNTEKAFKKFIKKA